jgi:hypothetical protein
MNGTEFMGMGEQKKKKKKGEEERNLYYSCVCMFACLQCNFLDELGWLVFGEQVYLSFVRKKKNCFLTAFFLLATGMSLSGSSDAGPSPTGWISTLYYYYGGTSTVSENWDLFRQLLLTPCTPQVHPELFRILEEGEGVLHLLQMRPEMILLR